LEYEVSLNVSEEERTVFLEGARIVRAWLADMKSRGRDVADSLAKQGIPLSQVPKAMEMLRMMRRADIFHERTGITKVEQIEYHPGELEYNA
jgi:hypothetical protein